MVFSFFHLLSKYAPVVLIGSLVLTLLSLFSIKENLFDSNNRLIIDNSLEPFFKDNSGAYSFYQTTNQEFGTDKFIVVAFRPLREKILDLDLFLTIDKIVDQILSTIPETDKVVSITNTPQLNGHCIGKSYFHEEQIGSVCINILDQYKQNLACIRSWKQSEQTPIDLSTNLEADPEVLNPVLEEDDMYKSDTYCDPELSGISEDQLYETTSRDIYKIIEKLKKAPLIEKDLISNDKKTVSLIILFKPDSQPAKRIVIETLTRILTEADHPNIRIAFSGQPREEYESSKALRHDIFTILPVCMIFILLILFVFFQSFIGMIVPFIIVLTGLIWTSGLFGISGKTPNLVTLILPTLLTAVGSAYVIHFMTQYYQAATRFNSNRSRIIKQTLSKTALPIFITAFTTIVGFLALTTSPIPAIKEMGLFSSFGVASISFLCLTLAPSLLKYLPPPKLESRPLRVGLSGYFLSLAGKFITRYSKRMILFWILIGLLALIGVFQISIDNKMSSFSDNSNINKDKNFIETHLAGTSNLRLILSSEKEPELLQSVATIHGLVKLTHWLQSPENISQRLTGIRFDKIYSPHDFLRIERQGLDNLSDEEIKHFFLRFERKNTFNFLNKDQSLMRIDLRLKVNSTADFLTFKEHLENKLKEFLPNIHIQSTGSAILASESANNIAKSQIFSLSLALIFIFAILSILFFSIKMGILALYPNVLSILIFFGTLGWLSIPVGVTISVIASIALGIGVDDTIHFITHYNEQLHETKNEKAAIQQTLNQIGKPMIYTTIALALGFSILTISEMRPQVLFGVLTAFTLVVCLASDLNLLPSILAQTKLITAWDYFTLKYSEKFLWEIDIFNGMSRREVKLAMLVTDTKEYQANDVIYVENEPVQDLYVILEGRVEIYMEKKYHRINRILAVIEQGKAFGTLALFPQTKRMTSAKAASNVHLLVLNRLNLIQIKKRYPGIATKLFINLSRSLEESIKNRYYRKVGGRSSDSDFQKKTSDKMDLTEILDQMMTGIARSRILTKVGDKFLQLSPKWISKEVPNIPEAKKKTDIENRELVELIEQIISSGSITYNQRLLLKQYTIQDTPFSVQLQDLVNKLKWLILEGKVVELKPQFANIFNTMTQRNINWLKNHYETKKIPTGVRIFSQGDFGDYMMIVLSGRFNTQLDVGHNTFQITTLIPGDLVGEMSVISNDCIRSVTAKATEESEVVFVSKQGFQRMLKTNKKLAALFSYNLVGMLSHRLRRSTLKLYR